MHNLAVVYEHGWGVPVDHQAAMSWVRRGAAAGDKAAIEALKQ
jgi:TPR repeat protein